MVTCLGPEETDWFVPEVVDGLGEMIDTPLMISR